MIEHTLAQQEPVYIGGAEAAATFIVVFFIAFFVVSIALSVLFLVAGWRLFSKGNCPGWAIFVPFYNIYCLFRLLFGKGWLFLLLLIPLVNIIVVLIIPFRLGAVFGDGLGSSFGLGLGFLFLPEIFLLLVGLGPFDYNGPN